MLGDYGGDFVECDAIPCEPPANDDCAAAQTVGEGEMPFDLSTATLDASAGAPCDADMLNDAWFVHTAACTGMLTVNTCSANAGPDTVLEVYAGSQCPTMGSPAPIACADDSGCGPGGGASSWTQSVTAGQTYLMRVGAADVGASAGELLVSCLPSVGTGGACCVGGGTCQNVASQAACTSLGGTFQGTGTNCGFLAPVQALNTAMRVHTCNSSYDTLLRIFDSCGGNLLTENDDCNAGSSGSDPSAPCFNAPGGTRSCVCFTTQPGQTYYIQVLSASGGPPTGSTSIGLSHVSSCGN
jgi:hypothetical protein